MKFFKMKVTMLTTDYLMVRLLKDVARQRYGDPSLDWAIILFNGLTDPFVFKSAHHKSI